ncbi:unnamed protein product [Heligmosomoides polygyrus]|uniref:C2H2-type domain-containing protein n=1 Tax=Heligmosomoides polygyrus TaxID=6339 RepID=A0A3P8BB74_HELPZ|nr:unnamed protein product [Heligmosomoides polygyrus]
MSLSDFWVHRLISTTTTSPVPSCSSASSDDISKVSSSDHPPLLKPEALKPTDYNAFQMLQMQLMWQPQLMQNFLAMIHLEQEQRQREQQQRFKEISSETIVNPRKRPPSAVIEARKTKQRKLGDDKVNASPVSGMFIKINVREGFLYHNAVSRKSQKSLRRFTQNKFSSTNFNLHLLRSRNDSFQNLNNDAFQDESAVPPAEELQKDADSLDETAAYVEVSEESRKKIEAIENVIGDCVCCLCKVRYDDVFKLAQHRCPRIAHEEYRCPECEKIFSCPANLASHRRWHRPRDQTETFRCMSCSSTFATRKDYKAHSCPDTTSRPCMPFGGLLTSLLSAPLTPLKLEMH